MTTAAAALAASARTVLSVAWLDEMETTIRLSQSRRETMLHLSKETFVMLSSNAKGATEAVRARAATSAQGKDATAPPTSWKERGNEFFKTQDFDRAIECFTQGLRELSVHSRATASVQAILSVHPELLEMTMQHAYDDATRAIQADPSYAKAWFRRGKVLEGCHISSPSLAVDLCHPRLHRKECRDVADAIARDLLQAKNLVEGASTPDISPSTYASERGRATPPTDQHSSAFHASVAVTSTPTMGRSIQATQPIAAGTVLLTETPHVLAIGVDNACSACARLSPANPLPCDYCSVDIYCDEACRADAWAAGHCFDCSMPVADGIHLDALCRVILRLVNRRRGESKNEWTTSWQLNVANAGGIRPWTSRDLAAIQALVHFPPLPRYAPSITAATVLEGVNLFALTDRSLGSDLPVGLLQLEHDRHRLFARLFVRAPHTKAVYTGWLTELQKSIAKSVQRPVQVVLQAGGDAACHAAAESVGFSRRSNGHTPSLAAEFEWTSTPTTATGGDQDLDLQSHLATMPPRAAVDTVLFVSMLAVLDPWRAYLDDDDGATTLSLLLTYAGQLPTNVLAITATTHSTDRDHTLSQVSQTRVGVGVYLRTAMANHSCVPNAFVRFDNATLCLIASRDIAADEHVFISYGPHASKMDGPQRHHHLQAQYYFACACDACRSADGNPSHQEAIDRTFLQRTQAVEDKLADTIARATSPDDLARVHYLATALLRERRAALPATHVLVGRAHDLVAQIAATSGDFASAASHSLKSLAILEKLYAPLDAELGHEYLKAAQLLFHAGQVDAVATPLARAKASLSLHLPPHDPALADLADLLTQLALTHDRPKC